MDPVKVPMPIRQRKLLYAEDDTWKRLPAIAREVGLTLLTQILKTVTLHERNARSTSDERQDSN